MPDDQSIVKRSRALLERFALVAFVAEVLTKKILYAFRFMGCVCLQGICSKYSEIVDSLESGVPTKTARVKRSNYVVSNALFQKNN